MAHNMKTGDIWQEAETYNETLFDTVDHFEVTINVLNGEWKEKGIEHPLGWKFSIFWDTKEYFKKIMPMVWRVQ